MSEREGFLRAICADPDDDTVRLAFADWLQEHGESNSAEFIRLHIAWCRREPDAPPDEDLRLRLVDAWLGSGCPDAPPLGQWLDAYDRGFIAGVWFPADFGLARAESLVSNVPVRVVATDHPSEEDVDWLTESAFLARLGGLGCYRPSWESVQQLLASPRLCDLELLGLEVMTCDSADAVGQLLASATHLNRLAVLDLDGTHIEDAGLEAIAAAPQFRTLRKLTMRSDNRHEHRVGEVGLRALAESQVLTGLTHLGFYDCALYAAGVRQLIRWPGVPGVIELDLALTELDGEGVIELARCRHLKSLRRLCLSARYLTGEAMEALASADWLPHLRQLWLDMTSDYGYAEGQTEEAFKAFSARLGPKLIMPAGDAHSFVLSPVNETDRIWKRLRQCGDTHESIIKLDCIL